MSRPDEPIHQRLVALAALTAGDVVVDLGCGAGPTLAALSLAAPEARLLGVDRSEASLHDARRRLDGHPAGLCLAVADLRAPLPLEEASVDVVISYNVVECVPDPGALLRETARVLRPGGRLVLAHTDFDSLVIAGADVDLDRRVCHAYADLPQPWMDSVDGRIGRKLPGLIRPSPLHLTGVEPLVTATADLAGHAASRIDEIDRALSSAAERGSVAVSVDDVQRWHRQLRDADEHGVFYFAETTVIVTAQRP